jgi:hypothetical protein
MPADLRDVLHRAAGPHEAPDTEEILARARTLRRRRQARTAGTTLGLPLLAIVVVLIVTGGILPGSEHRLDLAGPSAVGSVLPVPAAGEVAAVHLDDGTPVFVVHETGGTVHVVDALDPHSPDIPLLVAWCTSAQMFEDQSFGSRFWPDGGHAGGPAPTALATYTYEGPTAGSLRITARRDPVPRPAPNAEPAYTPQGPSCDSWEQPLDHLVAHHIDGDAASPEAAVAAGSDRDLLVEGVVEIIGGEPARLCTPGPGIPRCPVDAPVAPVGPRDVHDPDYSTAYIGRFLVTVTDGRIERIIATGAVAWDGRAFRGEERKFGTLTTFPPPAGSAWSGAYFGPPDIDPELLLYELEWLTGEEANAAARVAGEVGPDEDVPNGYFVRDPGQGYFALHLAEDVEILGSIVLTGNVEATPVPLSDLRAFVESDERAGSTTFWVTFRKIDGRVTRIEEQYRP